MPKRNYLAIEHPDGEATVDFLTNEPIRDGSVTIKREGNTLRIIARAINPGGDTWDEKEMEIDLSLEE